MAKVYFILGCTACGKGAAGRDLARRVGGQIVSVDSMKIYRRMNIGTATPTAEQLARTPHHCIDVVEPSESFSVARYVDCADQAIERICDAGQVALAVGGTSLYVKALSEGLFAGPPGDADVRAEIKAQGDRIGLEALHAQLAAVDRAAAERIHPNDARRIVRALEVYRTTGTPISELQSQWGGALRHDCTFIGLRRGKDDQSRRINARVRRMMELGLPDEVAALQGEPAGMSRQAAAAVGYAEILAHFRGEMTLDQAIERIKINTRRLAKKQRTWHRRFSDVRWFDLAVDETPESAVERIMREVDFTAARASKKSGTEDEL